MCLLFARMLDFMSGLRFGWLVGWMVGFFLGGGVLIKVWNHLAGFEKALWDSLFHESTSPVWGKRILDPDLLVLFGKMRHQPVSCPIVH